MWKANTSALLVNALKTDPEKASCMSRNLREKTKDLCTLLAPLTRSKPEDVGTQISDITNEALDLDQLFSKQVAEIYWTMGTDESDTFREASMELQQGEKRAVEGQKVRLVVAPGLIRRGRSTGENYEMKSMLLRMTVSCELISADKTGLLARDFSKPAAVLRGLFNIMKELRIERA